MSFEVFPKKFYDDEALEIVARTLAASIIPRGHRYVRAYAIGSKLLLERYNGEEAYAKIIPVYTS